MFLENFIAYLLSCLIAVSLIGFLLLMYIVHIILGAVMTVILLCAIAAWMEAQ